MKNGIGSLNSKDFWNGLIITFLSTLLTGIYGFLSTGALPTWEQFKPYLISSIAAGVSYVIHALGSNNAGQFLKKDVSPQTPVSEIQSPK